MACTDKSRERLRKKYTKKNWHPQHANLIYMISKYPIAYVPLPSSYIQRRTRFDKSKWDEAWLEISSKLDQPLMSCKQLWRNIKFKYAKIMNLIKSGVITRKIAETNSETKRFFDGRLSFMDPYLCELGDDKIPHIMHKAINDIFGLRTKRIYPNKVTITHGQVKALLHKRKLQGNNDSDDMDTDSLQSIKTAINTAVKCKLEELLQINNTLPFPSTDIVYNNDENAVNSVATQTEYLRNMLTSKSHSISISSDEENTSEHNNMGLHSELIIKNDDTKEEHNDENINMEDEDGVRDENLEVDINLNNETNIKVDLGNTTTTNMPAGTTLEDSNDEVSDAYIRNFFKELGVVMSLELFNSKPKQKELQSRINELLVNMLVYNKTEEALE